MNTQQLRNTLLCGLSTIILLCTPGQLWSQEVTSIESPDGIPETTGDLYDNISNALEPFFDRVPDNVLVQEEEYIIDLSDTTDYFSSLLGEDFTYQWSITGREDIITARELRVRFQESGSKTVTFSVFTTDDDGEPQEVYSRDLEVFSYTKSIPVVIFDPESDVNEQAREQGVLLYSLTDLSAHRLQDTNILATLLEYRQRLLGEQSDYVLIVGDRQEALSLTSKVHQEISERLDAQNFRINFVSMTDMNLDSFLRAEENFLSGKEWIGQFLVTSETSLSRILEHIQSDALLSDLSQNQYPHTLFDKSESAIPSYRILSRFIGTLSEAGFSTQDILIILSIPFLLTLLVIFKHFIGLGGTGIMLPVFLVVLAMKLGFVLVLLAFVSFFILNLLIHRLIGRYYMLYIPRIATVLVINFIVFIVGVVLLAQYQIFMFDARDSLYIIMFIFLLERMIAIVWSKEFHEYIYSVLNTLIFVSVAFLLFTWSYVELVIGSYPESMIILVFINIFLGRYKGLRITEYFRFREVVRGDIQEEEE